MTIPQFQVCITGCECSGVGVIITLIIFLSSAELSQAVQGDGSRYGDCVMVASSPKCLSK